MSRFRASETLTAQRVQIVKVGGDKGNIRHPSKSGVYCVTCFKVFKQFKTGNGWHILAPSAVCSVDSNSVRQLPLFNYSVSYCLTNTCLEPGLFSRTGQQPKSYCRISSKVIMLS